TPVEMKMPYAMTPPTGEAAARAMMSTSVPLELAGPLQQAGGGLLPVRGEGMPRLGAPPGMGMPGPGMGVPGPGIGMPGPGRGMPGPGRGMPGPGRGRSPQRGLPPGMNLPAGPLGGPGAVAAVGSLAGPGGAGAAGGPGNGAFQAARTQIRF